MNTIDALKERENRHRLTQLCYSLAKVLESTPASVLDDSPSAEWLNTVERLWKEIIAMSTGFGSIKQAIAALSTLDDAAGDARQLLEENFVAPFWNKDEKRKHSTYTVGDVWLQLLAFARDRCRLLSALQTEVEHRDGLHKVTEITLTSNLEAAHKALEDAYGRIDELHAEVEDLRSRGPRRWKTA